MTVPLLCLSISTWGVTLNGFAKNIAQDIAIDSARYGALADSTLQEAESHARDEIAAVVGKRFSSNVAANKISKDSSCFVSVTVNLSTIPIGFLKTVSEIKETGYAACELE